MRRVISHNNNEKNNRYANPTKKSIFYMDFFFEIQNLKYTLSRVSYQTGNSSLVLYDKSKFLLVPVTNNGTLAPSLTINR